MKAVFLGRFQPLHNGHHQVIEDLKEKYDNFKVVIGSSNKSREEENPLTFEERKEIIKACFPDLEISKLPDYETDKEWVEELEKLDIELVLTGNENVRNILDEKTSIEVEEPEMFHPGVYSGSEVRRRIKSDEEWRYLVPSCSKQKIEKHKEKIKKSGIQYEFEPGWKRENSSHGKTK